MRIGKCVSTVGYRPDYAPARKWGIFKYPEVARRLAVATPRAFRDLSRNERLLQDLDEKLHATGKIDAQMLILAGFVPEIISGRSGWQTFGIHYFNPPAEESTAYRRAMDLIYSQDKGPNRRIYFGLLGVDVQGYENLSNELFCKLLGRIGGTYDNPKFDGVRYIRVSSEYPLDQVETTENGETRIVIAMRMLWNEPNKYVPKRIDMNPVLPSPLPPPKPN